MRNVVKYESFVSMLTGFILGNIIGNFAIKSISNRKKSKSLKVFKDGIKLSDIEIVVNGKFILFKMGNDKSISIDTDLREVILNFGNVPIYRSEYDKGEDHPIKLSKADLNRVVKEVYFIMDVKYGIDDIISNESDYIFSIKSALLSINSIEIMIIPSSPITRDDSYQYLKRIKDSCESIFQCELEYKFDNHLEYFEDVSFIYLEIKYIDNGK